MRPTMTGPTFDDTFDAILPVAGSIAALLLLFIILATVV